MFKLISNLFNLLSPYQRKRFYILQFLVILMTILEILGVASIIPFMALVGDMTQLQQDTFFAKFYQILDSYIFHLIKCRSTNLIRIH